MLIMNEKFWKVANKVTSYIMFVAGLQMLAVSYLEYSSPELPYGVSQTQVYLIAQGIVVAFGLLYLAIQTFIYLIIHRIVIKDFVISWAKMNYFIIISGGPLLFCTGLLSRAIGVKWLISPIFQGLSLVLTSFIFIGTIYFFYRNKVNQRSFLNFSLIIIGLNTILAVYKILSSIL